MMNSTDAGVWAADTPGIDALLVDVQRLADEATPDILPRLLKILLSDDRPGLAGCCRHRVRLYPYIKAQITLTRAKRAFSNADHVYTHDPVRTNFERAVTERDVARRLYRDTPCTCWVPKR